ncbi:MAG: DegV family protein [Anaerolineae bacterium]
MNSVRIVADSGCDLPAVIAAQLGITIVPVYVRFDQEMVPSSELSNTEFWERVERSSVAPATSSPPPGAFYQVFEKLVAAGHDVICLTLPARHSGTFNAAWAAAQEFGERVRVIDTGSFSVGMGLQVLAAAKEALAGRSAEFIQQMLEDLRRRTSIVFALDTLEYVRRGGRLDRIMPLIERVAAALRVKPIVEMSDGEFRFLGVARSTRGALQRIEEELRSRLPLAQVAAAYTRGCEVADELITYLAGLLNVNLSDILAVEAGPAFAAHAGPKALGAALIRGR